MGQVPTPCLFLGPFISCLWFHGSPPPSLFLGLAVHQIITITVSLIMVIAALITTLVLKNW